MPRNKRFHLVCNAHLDPVWLWEWQEGVAEALSTFRTAAELCEQNDTFVFNHNEAILYKWVQQYEPQLFKRIQKLVKAGRWHIMGGWYLQPDCNIPSGESFIRQILAGRTYFKKHFDVEPTTAINFDPFGHSRGLVQILAKSGYDSYLFGRPTRDDAFELPGDDFVWVGFDGSQVLATRFDGWYNSPLGKAREKIQRWLDKNGDHATGIILWGVGNHGGGPSRLDLRRVNRLIEQYGDGQLIHSTPEAYFKDLRRSRNRLPKVERSLNPCCIGCYTSMIRVKQAHRQLENEIYSLEKMASAASVQGLMKYPGEEIDQALEDLLFCEFHDILPGSSIQPVEEYALQRLHRGLATASDAKARTFFALASGQPKARSGEIPILVYNPHPHQLDRIVECEFSLPDFNDSGTFTAVQVYHNGKPVPTQVEKEHSTLPVDFRKHVVFQAPLPASQMSRFDCRLSIIDKKPPPRLKARRGRITFRNKRMQVVINTRTGLIDRYRVDGVDYVQSGAFQPLVIADDADPWSMFKASFRRKIGRFKLMPKAAGTRFSGLEKGQIDSVRVIEDGPVRSVIEAVLAYNNSFICQQYKLPKQGTEIEIQTRVHWNEKDKMLKLSIPVVGDQCDYLGQVACGVERLADDGSEVVAQKWVAVVNRKNRTALTCINDGVYGSDFSKDGLRITLLRSPAYSAHHPLQLAKDRYLPRIDQGERLFKFWINADKAGKRLDAVDREALAHNEKPFALSFYPSGEGSKPKPLAILSDPVVQITAIKKAQTGNDLIIRLFEPTGRKRTTTVTLPTIPKKIKLELDPFEIKTLKINPATGKWVEVSLIEKPLRR